MKENFDNSNGEFIDLHTHTTASDGTLNPEELIAAAAKEGLFALAITDHDTMNAIPSAYEAALSYKLRLIPGIEMSAAYMDTEIHILGYLPDKKDKNGNIVDKAIFSDLAGFAKERDARNLEIIRRLRADGINIRMEDLYFGNPNTKITRAHFARFLMQKGYVRDINSAFDVYLKNNGKYCPAKTTSVEKVMAFFCRHGFFISLAHPLQYRLSNYELESLISKLKNSGMRGLEVYHSTHHPSDTKKLSSYAVKYGLLPTGGSDFHGANKPDIKIGRGYGGLRIPKQVLLNMDAAMQNFKAV